MNAMTALAQHAYAPPKAPVETPRDIEYRAFAKITRALTEARDLDGPEAKPALARALHDNVRLWSALAEDCMSDGNRLPEALRAQIIGLAFFARAHMRKVMEGSDGPQALIDVNMSIMRGLRGGGSGAA